MKTPCFFYKTLTVILGLFLCAFRASPQPQEWPETAGKALKKAELVIKAPEIDLKPPLDLSLPVKNLDDSKPNVNDAHDPEQTVFDELFTTKARKPQPPVQLKGNLINSVEPEVEKRKSVDGAGIMINFKE